jgi:hypothetical protein
MSTPTSGGFLRDVFDLSFTRFVTGRVIKVLFVLTLLVLFIAYVGIAIAIFSGGGTKTVIENGELVTKDSGGNSALGIVWLVIVGPLVMFLYALFYRVFFELLIVIFRIYENTTEQVALLRGGADPGPHAPAGPSGPLSPPGPPAPGGSSSGA